MKWKFWQRTDHTADLSETLRIIKKKLDYLESVASMNASPDAAYLGEVTQIYKALGPATFKGAFKTCFATPEEVQQVRGENTELRQTLENAVAALDLSTRTVGALTMRNAELAGRFQDFERRFLPLPKDEELAS